MWLLLWEIFYDIYIYKRLLSVCVCVCVCVCVSGVGVQTVGPIATKFGRKVESHPGSVLGKLKMASPNRK